MANSINRLPQHILPNSSTGERIQQSGLTQAEAQHKYLATKIQKEKEIQRRTTQRIEKQDQIIITGDQERERKQGETYQPKNKAGSDNLENRSGDESENEGSENKGQEGTPRIDITI